MITTDGRTLVGILFSADHNTNLVLTDTIERTIVPADSGEQSSEAPLGVYMVRGDSVVIVGEVDEELDASIDWEKVQGELIGGTYHA